ncbi:hypothetical protein NM688_g4262 [Phlebia brevispora]|uniref:Uncharacterized protein n=1 Tax=Phlebia brevispora TaxID=194682 RepID=A0ACC1T404_9APHY|nr:hypothetical protein NM688_g4262 [Phlebia brevispora]
MASRSRRATRSITLCFFAQSSQRRTVMDPLNNGHDIAPEFVAFLTEKLRTTRESLKCLEQENGHLRKELEELQNRSQGKGNNAKLEDDPGPDVTCRAGICPAKDEANVLSETVHTLENQLAAQLQEHTAEVAHLQERLDRTKSKYAECKAKLKDCRKGLEQSKKSTSCTGTEAQSVDANNGRTKGQDITGDLTLDERMSSHEAVQITPHEKSRWQQQARTVCVSASLGSPLNLSPEIMKLSKLGFLYLPAYTMLQSSGESAWIYVPRQNCSPTMPMEWTANCDFDQHQGRTRELFYRSVEGVCYAGIYVHDRTSETTWKAFRFLEQSFRDRLFRHTFPVHPSAVSQDVWDTAYQMYWDGASTLQRYRLRRVGFNQELYDAMTTVCGSPSAPELDNASQSEGSKKRKAPKISGTAPVPKKPRK